MLRSVFRIMSRELRRNLGTASSAHFASILSSEFDADQENKILELLNTVPVQALHDLKYFTAQKAVNLVKYRDEYGQFSKLSDILAVPGFGVLGIKRIAKAILNNETTVKTRQISGETSKSRTSICNPRFPVEKCAEVETVVSLDIQQDSIFWVQMDRSLSVENWQKTPIFSAPNIKYDHAEFHENIHHAVSSIPEADVYLLENKIYRCQYLKVVPIVISLRLIEAITITMLNQHHFTNFGSHCVYTIKPHAVSNHFNLVIGGERVSCQHIVRDVINLSSSVADGASIPDHLADFFFGLNHSDQENLTRAFLLPILFYKKVILSASERKL